MSPRWLCDARLGFDGRLKGVLGCCSLASYALCHSNIACSNFGVCNWALRGDAQSTSCPVCTAEGADTPLGPDPLRDQLRVDFMITDLLRKVLRSNAGCRCSFVHLDQIAWMQIYDSANFEACIQVSKAACREHVSLCQHQCKCLHRFRGSWRRWQPARRRACCSGRR
jgi:hypothetical protein